MSTIDITRAHTLAKDEARKRVEDLAKSLQSRFNLNWRWVGDAISSKRPGARRRGRRGRSP